MYSYIFNNCQITVNEYHISNHRKRFKRELFYHILSKPKTLQALQLKKIGGINYPNKFEDEEQIRRVHMLCAEVYNHFKNGGGFYKKDSTNYKTHKDYLKAALHKKMSENYSHHYIKFLNHIYTRITQDLGAKNLSSERLNTFLSIYQPKLLQLC